MVKFCDKKGFSITEILVVIAILAILVTLVLGAGKRLKAQAEEKLAKSTIGVLVAAIEHYYDYHGNFPVIADASYDEAQLFADLTADLGAAVALLGSGVHLDEYSSSEALFYFLDKNPDCRSIVEAIGITQMTCKDAVGVNLIVEVDDGSGNPLPELPLIRFIDPWGNAFRYEYAAGDTFPVITSGGPDGDIDGTPEDNVSSL